MSGCMNPPTTSAPGGATVFTKLKTSIPQACDNNLFFNLNAMQAVKVNSASDATHN